MVPGPLSWQDGASVASNYEIAALFDLDGTLLRAGDPAHRAGFEHALRVVFGIDATLEGMSFAGQLDAVLAERAMQRAGIPAHVAAARAGEVMTIMGRFYRLRVGVGDRLDWVLPGVMDVLRKLRAAGVAIATASGSAREVAEAKLAAAGLADYLAAGAFGDEVRSRPELLRSAVKSASRLHRRPFALANAVVVGDTPADIDAARAIGARVVAVATGPFTPDELDQHGPDALFVDLSNADAVIKAILR